MPNTSIGGFRYLKSRQSGNYEPVEEAVVASGYGTAIFEGDCVKKLADGTVAVCAVGDAVYAVVQSVKHMKVAGEIKSGRYAAAGLTYTGAPVTTNPQATVLYVCPVKDQVFEASVNTAVASETAAQSLVGNNFDITLGAGGSTSSGRSSHAVDVATAGTATAQVRMIEFQKDPSNDVTANNWRAQFVFNEITEPTGGGTAGV